jgi:VanZ family protein
MKRLLPATAIIFLALLVLIVVAADRGALPQPIRNLYDFPGGDKLGHFLLFGLLGLLLNLSARRAVPAPRGLRIGLSLSLILSIGIALEEWSQSLFPARSADPIDLLASLAGLSLGGWLAWKFPERHP